jgi:hypothetical protein
MNRLCAVVVIAGWAALAGGCTPSLSESQAQAIARDAPTLIANHRAISIIEPSEWPASITALNPEGVFVSIDGLYIVTMTFLASQWGVFVPCNPSTFSPSAGVDPSFTRITEGVYAFHVSG